MKMIQLRSNSRLSLLVERNRRMKRKTKKMRRLKKGMMTKRGMKICDYN
jgi:hypothetical protein